MMKRAGNPAGHDFGDNRVPGAGQRVRECLTERPELDNQISLIMTHRDRVGDPTGQWAGGREAAGDAGYPPSTAAAPLLRRTGRQGFPTPAQGPLPVRPDDRNGGFPHGSRLGLSDSVPRGSRCRGIATPRAPGRKPQPVSMGEAVSMSHYQRDLVLSRWAITSETTLQ